MHKLHESNQYFIYTRLKRDFFLFLEEIPGVKTLLRFYFLFLFFIVTMSDSELTVYSVSSESDLSTEEGKKYFKKPIFVLIKNC